MPLVGAVAAPHSHLQLFTRPAENEKYKADVQKGRDAMIALRGAGRARQRRHHPGDPRRPFREFRFPLLSAVRAVRRPGGQGQRRHRSRYDREDHRRDLSEIRGQGVLSVGAERHPAAHGELGQAEALCLQGQYRSQRASCSRDCWSGTSTFRSPSDGTMDGEEVLTTNFLNPKADKKVMLLFTNGYVPPLPWPRRCYKLGQAIRRNSRRGRRPGAGAGNRRHVALSGHAALWSR